MLYPSIDEIRTKVDSKYTLVVLAAKRARDIIEGMPKLTEADVEKPRLDKKLMPLLIGKSVDLILYRRAISGSYPFYLTSEKSRSVKIFPYDIVSLLIGISQPTADLVFFQSVVHKRKRDYLVVSLLLCHLAEIQALSQCSGRGLYHTT